MAGTPNARLRQAPTQTLAVLGLLLGASGCLKGPIVRFQGRISFPDGRNCVQPLGEAQNEDWRACHQFKRHFDPVTGDYFVDPQADSSLASPGASQRGDFPQPNALRPLQATLTLRTLRAAPSNEECGKVRVPTTSSGFFDAYVPSCGPGIPSRLEASVELEAPIRTPNGEGEGKVRAVWSQTAIASIIALTPQSELDTTATEENSYSSPVEGTPQTFVIPTFRFQMPYQLPEADPRNTSIPVIQVGNRILARPENSDEFGYVQHALSAFASVVEIQNRVSSLYGTNSGAPELPDSSTRYVRGLFPNHAVSGWRNVYLVAFTADWATAGSGGINLLRPLPDLFAQNGIEPYVRLISETGTLLHEFSHSIHAGLAPRSIGLADYGFANFMERPLSPNASSSVETVYDYGHTLNQYQEMGTAFVEGVATGMGQFIFNGCRSWNPTKRIGGGVGRGLFEANMWSGDLTCDQTGDGCQAHHVRYLLRTVHGLAEGSPTYNYRLKSLQNLTAMGARIRQSGILSNNEQRYAEFVCDLLDADSDTQFSQTDGMEYIHDFTAEAARVMGGIPRSSIGTRRYVGNPVPEEIQIPLVTFIQNLNTICDGSACDFTRIPDVSQTAYSNDVYSEYVRRRVSVDGSPVSPQNLATSFVNQGLIRDRNELNNLLKSNWMEELR